MRMSIAFKNPRCVKKANTAALYPGVLSIEEEEACFTASDVLYVLFRDMCTTYSENLMYVWSVVSCEVISLTFLREN